MAYSTQMMVWKLKKLQGFIAVQKNNRFILKQLHNGTLEKIKFTGFNWNRSTTGHSKTLNTQVSYETLTQRDISRKTSWSNRSFYFLKNLTKNDPVLVKFPSIRKQGFFSSLMPAHALVHGRYLGKSGYSKGIILSQLFHNFELQKITLVSFSIIRVKNPVILVCFLWRRVN